MLLNNIQKNIPVKNLDVAMHYAIMSYLNSCGDLDEP
jgi:hypothetical protein